jgi:hypothetical protein
MPTMETASLDALYCLFTGEWGVRKSTQALTFPGPQYWFSFDQKMGSMLLPIKAFGIDPSTIHYDDYQDWGKAEKKLEAFQLTCPYKTIVIDTIGTCGDAINSQTLKLKRGTTTKDGAEKGITIAGIPVNSIEDYKAETSALQSLIRLTKDIHIFHKVNIILIAHVMIDEKSNEEKSAAQSRIIVSGARKMAFKIPGYCHEVYHFFMKREAISQRYAVRTTHSITDFARTALPLEKEIVLDDSPLYANYVKPAIEKLKNLPKK